MWEQVGGGGDKIPFNDDAQSPPVHGRDCVKQHTVNVVTRSEYEKKKKKNVYNVGEQNENPAGIKFPIPTNHARANPNGYIR